MKGGFGCSPCCGPQGCSSCGWTSDGYDVAGASRTNYCCESECFPCEITLEIAAGNTWGGFATRYLTTADRSDIASFLSGTWVLRHLPSNAQRYPLYKYEDSSWLAHFRLGQDVDTPCDAYWPSYTGGGAFTNGLYTVHNATSPVYTGGSLLGLSKSMELRFALTPFAPDGGPSQTAPFSFSDWCGVSSFSHTFTTPTSPYSNSVVQFWYPALSSLNTVNFSGHTVTISW
jgi:hypothetical protein